MTSPDARRALRRARLADAGAPVAHGRGPVDPDTFAAAVTATARTQAAALQALDDQPDDDGPEPVQTAPSAPRQTRQDSPTAPDHPNTPTPAPEPAQSRPAPAGSGPAGAPLPDVQAVAVPGAPELVTVDRGALAELQRRAGDFDRVQAEQATADRERVVDAAIRAGRVTPARRDAVLASLAAGAIDPADLDALPAVVPVGEPLGHGAAGPIDAATGGDDYWFPGTDTSTTTTSRRTS